MTASMTNHAFVKLLIDIHKSLDRVCEDLERDRPELASALRIHASWIPRPEEVVPALPPTARESVRALRPLLYDALDAGFVDGQRFDALMLERARAQRVLESREP
jgi:hypothetical protein